MGIMNEGFSLADAMALTNGKDEGYGGGTWIWVFFLFFLLAWGGGGFFGSNNPAVNNPAVQGALTRSDLFEGFGMNNVDRQLQGLQGGLCQGFYGMSQSMHGISDLINQSRFDNSKCCCETNRNIDAVRYENAKNTCDIINAGHADTQRIIDTLTTSEMQRLRDELQVARGQLSNFAQTQNLIDTLRPYPNPAYITCSPYESTPLPGNIHYQNI